MSILIEGLPNDIAIRCLARLPFYLFPKLETVSHSWQAAVHSTEFYKVRQAVNSTESLLCVCAYNPQKHITAIRPKARHLAHSSNTPTKVRNLAKFHAVSVSGKLSVLGGRSCPLVVVVAPKNEVWAYDPISRRWAQRAPMTVPRSTFACCVWNGKILVAGGYNAPKKSTSNAKIYDPNTDTWDQIPDIDDVCNYPCMGFVIDGAVHVVNMTSKEVQVLESLKDTWQHSHSLNQVSLYQGLITVVNGTLYGKNDGNIYKLEHGKWKFVSPLEFNKRYSYGMIGIHDSIYVIGGVIVTGGGRFEEISDVDVLLVGNEKEKQVWKKVVSMTRCQGYIIGCAELRI